MSRSAIEGTVIQDCQHEDASSGLNVHTEPLMLLVVAKSHNHTLVSMQLCTLQGVSIFSFDLLPPRVSCPFFRTPVYSMTLTHADRLCAVGCALKGQLVRLLSLGMDHQFVLPRNVRVCRKMMQIVARRVAAGLATAVRDKFAEQAQELCESGHFAAAAVPMHLAIHLGDMPSRALEAWLLIHGREGFAKNTKRGFEIAVEGAQLGCHQCQGVLAVCCLESLGCEYNYARSLELARESSDRGSRYGQYATGKMHILRDRAQALLFFGLAAAQGLDAAQFSLGTLCFTGDRTEALMWMQSAAAQGHPEATCIVAFCHQFGLSVAADVEEAVRLYTRARAAGSQRAAEALRMLGR